MTARLEGGPLNGVQYDSITIPTYEAVVSEHPFIVATYVATDETRTTFRYHHSTRHDVLPPYDFVDTTD